MENENKVVDRLTYNKSVNNLGRITVLICVMAFVFPVFAISIIKGIEVPMAQFLAVAMPLLLTFAPSAIAENLSYAPIIGAGGLYVGCITGNLGNMKIPAALNAMSLIDEEPGTEKADVVSVLAICSASIVTMCITTLGMIFLAPLVAPLLSVAAIQPAFNNLVPALTGAILFPQLKKNWQHAIVPYILAVGAILILGRSAYSSNQGYLMICIILINIAVTYFRFKDKK